MCFDWAIAFGRDRIIIRWQVKPCGNRSVRIHPDIPWTRSKKPLWGPCICPSSGTVHQHRIHIKTRSTIHLGALEGSADDSRAACWHIIFFNQSLILTFFIWFLVDYSYVCSREAETPSEKLYLQVKKTNNQENDTYQSPSGSPGSKTKVILLILLRI